MPINADKVKKILERNSLTKIKEKQNLIGTQIERLLGSKTPMSAIMKDEAVNDIFDKIKSPERKVQKQGDHGQEQDQQIDLISYPSEAQDQR